MKLTEHIKERLSQYFKKLIKNIIAELCHIKIFMYDIERGSRPNEVLAI